ncbi:C-protein, skeletal muscle slow isoform [Intoshia linei]|uniref:C-protein, skeletal muscle slow isoform n=1 Tax=Intoshia linei TaxID=1819745 RepID=A0A177BC15_9BILA|nr:C-protein, skeletal muscle slow isoform [Intoshia linei]
MIILIQLKLIMSTLLLLSVINSVLAEFKYGTLRFITEPPKFSAEYIGNRKFFDCFAKSSEHEQVTYSWLKNGKFIAKSTNRGLKLSNIEIVDGGIYRCIASDDFGSIISNDAILNIYHLSVNLTSEFNLTTTKGSYSYLTLPDFSAYPYPNISWYKQIDSKNRIHLISESVNYSFSQNKKTIIILNTLYPSTFVAKLSLIVHIYDNQQSPIVKFNVMVENTDHEFQKKPLILEKPQNLHIAAHSMAVFDCIIHHFQSDDLSIEWFKCLNDSSCNQDSVMTSSDNIEISLYGRHLKFLRVKLEDTSYYYCKISSTLSKFDSFIYKFHLTVLLKPILGLNGKVDFSQLKEGDVIKLEYCSLNSGLNYKKDDIHWYMNSKTLANNYNIHRDGSLSFKYNSESYSGYYQCFVENIAGKIKSPPIVVDFAKSEPVFIEKPNNVNVYSTSFAVKIKCIVKGNPPPKITWWKKDPIMKIVNSTKFTLSQNSSILEIANGNGIDDNGDYFCKATNEIGSIKTAFTIKFLITTSFIQTPQNKNVIKGSKAWFHCLVQHDSSVLINRRWYHDDSLLYDSNGNVNIDRFKFYENGTVCINSVRYDDIGLYTCQIESQLGKMKSSAYLRMLETPRPPEITSISLQKINVNYGIKFRWVPGFDGNSDILNYEIFFKNKTEDGDWKLLNEIEAYRNSYLMKNVHPSSRYIFSIRSVNSIGKGPLSESSKEMIIPAQPPSHAPINIKMKSFTNTSITVYWDAPDEYFWNGKLLGHNIRYKLGGYSDLTWKFINVNDVATKQYTIVNLIVFTAYDVQIAAYNEKGTGVYSEMMNVSTLEGIPIEPPVIVKIEAMSSTSVGIKWKQMHSDNLKGIAQYYEIVYCKSCHEITNFSNLNNKNIQNFKTVKIPVKNLLINYDSTYFKELKNLSKFTNYLFSIRVYTKIGSGPYSKVYKIVTKSDIPSKVKNLKIKDILNTSFIVTWSRPSAINGNLLNYKIEYFDQNQGKNMENQNFIVSDSTFFLKIDKLKPKTRYTVKISAKTTAGYSPVEIMETETGSTPFTPGIPKFLNITSLNSTCMILTFIPNFDGNSRIKYYKIHYHSALIFNHVFDFGINENSPIQGLSWSIFSENFEPIEKFIENTERYVKVDNLRPFHNYCFKLSAVSVFSSSEPSEFLCKNTLGSKPYNSNLNVRVHVNFQVYGKFVRVIWDNLHRYGWNDEIVYYTVYTSKIIDNVAVFMGNLTVSSITSFVDVKVESMSHYCFKVSLWNKWGSAQVDGNYACTDTLQGVPAQRNEIDKFESTFNSIYVHWMELNKKDKNGQIIGYKVQVMAKDSLGLTEIVVRDRYANLTNLEPSLDYFVKILPFTCWGVYFVNSNDSRGLRIKTKPNFHIDLEYAHFTQISSKFSILCLKFNIFNFIHLNFLNQNLTVKISFNLLKHLKKFWFEYRNTLQNVGLKTHNQSIIIRPVKTFCHTVMHTIPDSLYNFNIQFGSQIVNLPLITSQSDTCHVVDAPFNVNFHYDNTVGVGILKWEFNMVKLNFTGYNYRNTIYYNNVRYFFVDCWPVLFKSVDLRVSENVSVFKTVSFIVDKNANSANLSLPYFGRYKCALMACGDLHNSSFSKPTSIIDIPGSPPTGVPIILNIEILTKNSVSVEIKPPVAAPWNLHHYFIKVLYTYVNNNNNVYQFSHYNNKTVKSSLIVTVHDLSKRWYRFCALFVNKYGDGVVGDFRNVFVGYLPVAKMYTDLKVHNVQSCNASLGWDNFDSQKFDYFSFIGHQIYVVKEGRESRNTVKVYNVSRNFNFFFLSDLLPFTKYNIIVKRVGLVEMSDIVMQTNITTLESTPGLVENFQIFMYDVTKINVTWCAPRKANGIIKSYLVEYVELQVKEEHIVKYTINLNDSLLFNCLYQLYEGKIHSLYDVSITAETRIGLGEKFTIRFNMDYSENVFKVENDIVVNDVYEGLLINWNKTPGLSLNNITDPSNQVIVQLQEKFHKWISLRTTNANIMNISIAKKEISPETDFRIRIVPMNVHGIGYPSSPSSFISIENWKYEPIYMKWWFMVIIALIFIMIIIIIISVLCVSGSKHSLLQKLCYSNQVNTGITTGQQICTNYFDEVNYVNLNTDFATLNKNSLSRRNSNSKSRHKLSSSIQALKNLTNSRNIYQLQDNLQYRVPQSQNIDNFGIIKGNQVISSNNLHSDCSSETSCAYPMTSREISTHCLNEGYYVNIKKMHSSTEGPLPDLPPTFVDEITNVTIPRIAEENRMLSTNEHENPEPLYKNSSIKNIARSRDPLPGLPYL